MPIPPNIPWDQVLRHGPRVLDAATAMFEKWQARRPEPVHPRDEAPRNPLELVEQRLHVLETAEAEQSALVREMARDMQSMLSELERQRKRTQVALIIACIASALGVVALIATRVS